MIDSHCHLGVSGFKTDIDGMIERSFQANVTQMLSVACHPNDLVDLVKLIEKYGFIYGAFGIHPEYVGEMDVTPEILIQGMLSHPHLVAVGETGLDYYYNPDTKDKQIQAFKMHIDVAYRLKKPLIIHTRDAEADTIAVLTEAKESGKLAYGAVLHCFTGSDTLAAAALELGLYLSASGVITFSKSVALRDTFQRVPLNRLLVETDAPYLAPVPHRGKTNEPSFVIETANTLATLKNITTDELDTYTTANFKRLFQIK